MNYTKKGLVTLIIILFFNTTLFCQTAQDQFGKNRIQYQNFKWEVISTDNFDIYFYKQSQAAAVLAARYAEGEFDRITDLLGYAPYSRIKLVVYGANSDLQQSNIGLSNQQVFIGGYSVFLKNRVEVAFNGIQTDFTRDISKGISSMIVNEMLYSGSFKEVLQSTYFMSLPEWFLSGIIEYCSVGWTTENDDKIRDLFTNKKIKNPNRFAGDDARVIGLSIWNYIVLRYGKNYISSILSNTRYSRNYEKALEYSLSNDYRFILKGWKSYYMDQNIAPLGALIAPNDSLQIIKKPKDETYYGSIRLSPDGTRLAYVHNKKGRYKVVIKNLRTGSKNVVYRGGYKTFDQKVDYDMPVIAWRSNNKIGIVSIKKDKMKLITYDIKSEIESRKERFRLEVSNFFNIKYSQKQTYRGIYKHFKQVNDFNFNDDGSMVVVSGENIMGQSDIFLYNLRNNNVTKITNDIYDDKHPQFLSKSSKSFVFNSNRPNDSLVIKQNFDFRKLPTQHDIFMYNPDSSKILAKRLTKTPKFNEEIPKVNRFGDIFYLSDESGINQLYKTSLKDSTKHALTAFRQGMQTYDVNDRESSLAFITYNKGKNRIYLDTSFSASQYADSVWIKTFRQQLVEIEANTESKKQIKKNKAEPIQIKTQTELISERKKTTTKKDTTEIDIDNYTFDFERNPLVVKLDSNSKKSDKLKIDIKPKNQGFVDFSMKNNSVYVSSPTRYKHDFAIDNATSALRIDPIRGFGAVLGANMSDLMGNHRINAGLFFATNFRTSTMWAEYEYLKKRTDYRFRITKDVIAYEPGRQNEISHRYAYYKFEASASYPINPAMKVSFTPFYAWTNFTNLSPLEAIQKLKEDRKQYIGTSLEYTFDNTRSIGTNASLGTKVKIGYTQNIGLDNARNNFGKFHIDVRNYSRIHRELVLAIRIVGGTFIGPSKKSFLLGGMDNWAFNTRENNQIGTPLNRSTRDSGNVDLFFHEFATNMRGFGYSRQYGSSFLLANIELRLPIFKYLIRRRINSNFLRNFQTVVFYDIGSAWTGDFPFGDENESNFKTVTSGNNPPTYSARVRVVQNPFLSGYGFGVRSMILGYYAKFDCAWGIQDFNNQGVKLYLTFGYDF